jgi:general secretion pathway protein I
LSHATFRPTSGSAAGFTIIEALVALAVVTVTIVAIGSVMASNARGTRQLESHVTLVQAANNILWLNLPARADPVPPVLTGQSLDHDWRADIEPLAIELDAPADKPADRVSWVPQKIRLQVRSPSGSILSLETIRLFKVQAR